jgi:hypothetical protein
VGPGVGTTTIEPVVSGTGLDNFEITLVNGSYTIDKAPPTVVVTGGTFAYDGNSHEASGFAYGVGGVTDVLSPPVTFSYVGTGSTTYGPTPAAPVNAGTYQVTATFAGNDNYTNASNTANLSIVYNFVGFLQPIQNSGAVNTGKAGRTYPIKWQLTDNNGGYIADLASVVGIGYYQVGCGGGYEYDGETLTESTTGGTVLRYDTKDNQFIYNWQTPKKSSCYVFVVQLIDGTIHVANFSLK